VWNPVSNHVLGRQDGAFLRYLIACSVCLSHLFYVLLTSRFKDLRTYSLLTMISFIKKFKKLLVTTIL